MREAREAVATLLRAIGEDPDREGLRETPDRVVRALAEFTSGTRENPSRFFDRRFDVPSHLPELIAVREVEFVSLCEHHLLPFSGVAAVGYVPRVGEGVVGLSKLARVVDSFARRLQIQERMGEQIATCIEENVDPLGVGVVLEARHSCLGCRGARKASAVLTTRALRGVLRHDRRFREEFMTLALAGGTL